MFSGDLVLARRKTSLFELPLIGRIVPGSGEHGEEGSLRVTERRPGGWQVLEVEYGLPDDRDWLSALVAGTRGPVMIASVFQSRLCVVRGLEPGSTAPWSVRLRPESRNTLPEPAVVDKIAAWSTSAGTAADRDGLAAVLACTTEYFIEAVFYRLLDAVGLGEALEEEVDDGSNHSLAESWRDPAKLESSLKAMKPGIQRGLWCVEHENCFVKVLMLPDGAYELQYCEQSPGEVYRALAPSLDAVLAAMLDWSAAETEWRENFQWSRISASEP